MNSLLVCLYLFLFGEASLEFSSTIKEWDVPKQSRTLGEPIFRAGMIQVFTT